MALIDVIIEIVLLIIAIILIALCLFAGDKVFGNRRVELTKGYFINAVITAVIIIILIIAVGAVLGFLGQFLIGLSSLVPILAFVASVYAIKIILMSGADYERATWVGVIAWALIYIINAISGLLGFTLIQYI